MLNCSCGGASPGAPFAKGVESAKKLTDAFGRHPGNVDQCTCRRERKAPPRPYGCEKTQGERLKHPAAVSDSARGFDTGM